MNTLQESKGRLRLMLASLLTIRDNYGITSAQSTNFAIAKDELEDIIANMADVPPPAPVTVEDVVAGVMAGVSGLQAAIDNSNNGALHDLGVKIDSLIALANAHGTAQ
ncbi:hypothetical protein [Herbaspirillum rubrisubalbicans]|uniref:Uncharacterized protein n=1 Tax=Herbaspirillum rubrisubalbicans TaxID=80842 RepID=A0AAD0UBF9_9BURK|nr:hypothetical protein [Herbaspirillum rubrisubalbicans]AYR24550.1 hypothetical protein RC54_12240 [Herbaspirillum rubrisubalbicans]